MQKVLIAAINDPNPVIYFEHKALYRSISGQVPDAYYEIEIGKAKHVQEGEDISVITYGSGVHWALDYAGKHPELSLDITDLRTYYRSITKPSGKQLPEPVKYLYYMKTHLPGGIGGEVAAWIAEHCFSLLDAPVMRCGSLDSPIPFNIDLENFMAYSRMDEVIEKLMEY